ncbi:hypothetical protein ACA040_004368 [Xenophilus aerolatus]
MTKAEWSGWVQAFGAVVAIIATASIAWWQIRRIAAEAAEQRRLTDKHKLLALSHLLRRVETTLAISYSAVQERGQQQIKFSVPDLDAASEVLHSISPFDVPGSQTYGRMQVALRALAVMRNYGRNYAGNEHETDAAALKVIHLAGEYFMHAFDVCIAEAVALSRPSDPGFWQPEWRLGPWRTAQAGKQDSQAATLSSPLSR